MLERFERINKIGLFDSYVHSPGCDLSIVTLIYGENGVGKSTLAAILDSLRERNGGELLRRRSLPGNVLPTTCVMMNGKVYKFDGRDWDDQPPYDTLEVFFPGFVNRNVHAAVSVDPDHRRNLCEFVLGRTAVEKVTRLAQADAEGRSALAEKKAIESQLHLLIKNPDNLDTYLSFPNDPNIGALIAKVRAELVKAQSKDSILLRPVAKAITLPVVNQQAIGALLEKSVDGIGKDVANIIQEHIKKHLNKDGEKWLEYGVSQAVAESICPFCAQDIRASSLVATIRSYFSSEYREFTESLSKEIQEVCDQLALGNHSHFCNDFAAQVVIASQWTDDFPIDPAAMSTTIKEAERALKTGAQKLDELFARKRASPLERMDPCLADEGLAYYRRGLSMLEKVNDLLSQSGSRADARKASLSIADTSEIELRLNHLENQKERFEPLALDLVKKRNAIIEKRGKLDAEKKGLKKEIDGHGDRVVGKYQAGINYYLNHFGCDICIESVGAVYPSGRASVQYKLKAHGHEIELGVSSDGPCFETVLSDGDKYTLALSFFFARLKDHASLDGRVVVLDDPVNSLGSSRRSLIINAIRDLRLRGAQVVVLTHDELLAALVWRDRKLNKSIAALHVERTNSGSRLQQWDIERATQSQYVEHYLTLLDYLNNGGDHRPAAGCIRPYVEQRLRHVFPGPPFVTRDTLGEMIGKIRVCDPSSRLFAIKEKVSELEAINDASLPSHHATDDVPGMTPMAPADVRLFAQKALDILG